METGVAFAALDPDTEERFLPLRRMLGVTSFGLNQILLRPGQRGRIHRHTAQEEVYVVLSGTLTLGIEGEERELSQGELARLAPGVRRQLVNKGGDDVLLLALGGAEIQVTGFPNGFLYTDKPYTNYVLRYSWSYPKEQPDKTTMNSGLLVHIQPPLKVYPKSIEPQGRYKDHGKLFFIGFPKGAKTEAKFFEEAQKKALKPSYEWNTTEVTAKADGSIEVRINGTLVSTGKTELTAGPIGFQSEAARIHFKDIEIKTMK